MLRQYVPMVLQKHKHNIYDIYLIYNIHYLCFRQPKCKETNYLEEIDDGPKRYDVVSNM